jgi:hypothetical protein
VSPQTCLDRTMAQKTLIQLVDDIDGTVIEDGAGETVSFALDGKTYEVDLTNENADTFRGLFQDYIAVARRSGRASKARTSPKGGASAAEIREWAKSNGYDVPDRGRIPADVREAFDAK